MKRLTENEFRLYRYRSFVRLFIGTGWSHCCRDCSQENVCAIARLFRSGSFGSTQVGFAEFNNTADNRANIGGTIIGAPIVGQ